MVRGKFALIAAGVKAFRLSGEAVAADLTLGEDGVLRCDVVRRRVADSLGVSSKRLRLFPVGSVDELESDDDVRDDVQLVVLQPLRVAAASQLDMSVKMWNADAGVLDYVFYLPHSSTSAQVFMDLSSDGKRLAVASGVSVSVWNLELRSIDFVIDFEDVNVGLASFSHGGRRLAVAAVDGQLQMWNVATGLCEGSFRPGDLTAFLVSRSFSPDGIFILVHPVDCGGRCKVWNMRSGACEFTLPAGVPHGLHSVCFSPDGLRLAMNQPCACSVGIWCLKTCVVVLTLTGHAGIVTRIAFSSDGRRVATGSADKTVKIWCAVTGACERTLKGHAAEVVGVRFSADGRRLVTSCVDRTVKVWNSRTGVLELSFIPHEFAVTEAVFVQL